jgi:hypothetical protein
MDEYKETSNGIPIPISRKKLLAPSHLYSLSVVGDSMPKTSNASYITSTMMEKKIFPPNSPE